MKATKKEINAISKYLWKHGHGSKKTLADDLGFCQSEITRLLKGGTVSEEKLNAIKEVVEL